MNSLLKLELSCKLIWRREKKRLIHFVVLVDMAMTSETNVRRVICLFLVSFFFFFCFTDLLFHRCIQRGDFHPSFYRKKKRMVQRPFVTSTKCMIFSVPETSTCSLFFRCRDPALCHAAACLAEQSRRR